VSDNESRFDAINARFMAIENKMLDSDKDGVDYLDEEKKYSCRSYGWY
jgi:OOP family OmpA-OmpF porin